jgi:serine/threonine protein phosphatase PrpC
VKDGDLYVANVGDCRAVLGSRGGVATALTSDHTAGREDERRRIESSVSAVAGLLIEMEQRADRLLACRRLIEQAQLIN